MDKRTATKTLQKAGLTSLRKSWKFLFLAFYVLPACNSRNDFDGDYVSSLDNAIAAAEFSFIRNLTDIEVRNDTSVFKTLLPGTVCPGSVITVTQLGLNQGTLTIDFFNGIVCGDSRIRSGQLIVAYNGKWREIGSTLNISASGYTFGGMSAVFQMLVTHLGLNSDGFSTYSVEVNDGQIVTLQGTLHWTAALSVIWNGGTTNTSYTDNRYSVTGSGSGKSRYNYPFTWEIMNALEVQMTCPNVVEGSLQVTPSNRVARSLEYGNNNHICDDKGVIVLGDYREEITLP